LLGPFYRARTTGFEAGGLNYKTDLEHSDATIATAPKGWFPPTYTVKPHPVDLDPTALMYLERAEAEKDRPSSLIGRSSIQAELYDIGAMSSQFGEFWKRLCVIYGRALEAQKNIDQNTRKLLSGSRTVYEGDGDIAAFVMAVGPLTQSEIGLSLNDEVRVQSIMARVIDALKPHMDALDQIGFARGVLHLENTVGTGTLPHDGSAVTYLAAEDFETLYNNPMKRALTNPHARELLRQALTSRFTAEFIGLEEDFVIAEGTDLFIVPQVHMNDATSPTDLFDTLCTIVDGMSPLQGADYSRNAVDFLDQFRFTGDLVNALFVNETVTGLGHSYLEVFLSAPNADQIQGQLGITLDPQIWETGGLGSISQSIGNRCNMINGMTPWYPSFSPTMQGGNADLALQPMLPNQIMYMGSPASVTALDWLSFLQWYRRAHSSEAKSILDSTGRRKQDLKLVSTALADPGAAVADMISNSQRNGVSSKAYASFNLSKYGRIGQQGPVLVDTCPELGPAVVAGLNEWTRLENTGTIRRIGLDGEAIAHPSSGLCSSFVGEPQGRKAPSPLITPRIPTPQQLGDTDIDRHVATNLLSLPTTLDGTATLPHVTEVTTHFPSKGMVFNNNFNQRLTSVPQLWNLHPTEGFKRGYMMGGTTSGSWSGPSNMDNALATWARETTGPGYSLSVNTAAMGVITLALAKPGTASSADHPSDYISAGLPVEYGLQPYYGTTGLYGTATLPRSAWYWDPCRTVAVGRTNKALYGSLYQDVCFSAAQDQFVTVATGAIRLRDLQSIDPSTLSTCGAMLYPTTTSGVTSISAATGVSMALQQDKAILDSRIEQELGAYPAILPTQGWFDRMDVVSERFALIHNALIGVVTAANQVYTAVTASSPIVSVAGLSVFRRTMATMNACSKNPINRVSGHGINATDGVFLGVTYWPVNPSGTQPLYHDGPNILPLNDDANALQISGSGMCNEGYFAAHPYSIMSYLTRTITDTNLISSPAPYPTGEYAEPYLSAVAGAGPRANPNRQVTLDIPNVSVWSVGNTRIGVLPATSSTTNRWFISDDNGVGAAPPMHMADIRESGRYDIENPWTRKNNDGYGYEVLSYDPSAAARIMTATAREGLLKMGDPQRAGFTNEMWLKIQTQGI
jgi:hypothetical protein